MKYEVNKQQMHNCWKVTLTNENRPEKKNTWEKRRQNYYEGQSKKVVKETSGQGYSEVKTIVKRHKEIQLQQRRQKMFNTTYNPRYTFWILFEQAVYLRKLEKDNRFIARFRLGNEEKGNCYWQPKDEQKWREKLCIVFRNAGAYEK